MIVCYFDVKFICMVKGHCACKLRLEAYLSYITLLLMSNALKESETVDKSINN